MTKKINAKTKNRSISRRDPHSVETLQRFDQCIEFFANGNFTDKDVNEAKLATFQKVKFSIFILIFHFDIPLF